MNRKYKDSVVMYRQAKELSKKITDDISNEPYFKERESTEEERKILFGVLLGAITTLNLPKYRENKEAEEVVLKTADLISTVIFDMSDVNCYESVYLPLKKYLEDWKKETEKDMEREMYPFRRLFV